MFCCTDDDGDGDFGDSSERFELLGHVVFGVLVFEVLLVSFRVRHLTKIKNGLACTTQNLSAQLQTSCK